MGASEVGARRSDELFWCCPRCHGPLTGGDPLVCSSCGSAYQTVDGIPDLRVEPPSWCDLEADLALAHALHETTEQDLAETAALFFKTREPHVVEHHVRRVLSDSGRLARDLDGWLEPIRDADGIVLDVGCGLGGFVAAAAQAGCRVAGVDGSIAHLVFAKRLVSSAGAGATAEFAAATAERLPVASASVAAVTLIDVIEHVDDQASVVREVDRIGSPRCVVALTTANRYSLSAEPHVGVWGVGLLPRKFQRPYVQRRRGISYEHIRLFSPRELRALFARNSSLRLWSMDAALVPTEEVAMFSRRRRVLAGVYNFLRSSRAVARVMLAVGPSYNAVFGRDARRRDERVEP